MAEDNVDLDIISGLESRITSALDRIAAASAVNAIGAREADPKLAAAEAALEEQKRAAEEMQGRVTALEAELAEAKAAVPEASDGDEVEKQAELLQQRVKRLRGERNQIRDERDELAEELDNFRAAATAGGVSAEGPEALLSSLRELRTANESLRAETEALRQDAAAGTDAPDPERLNAAMAAELLSLRAERAADAAELEQILAEMRPLMAGGANG